MSEPEIKHVVEDYYFSPNWPDESPHPYRPGRLSRWVRDRRESLAHALIVFDAWLAIRAYLVYSTTSQPNDVLCVVIIVVGFAVALSGLFGACGTVVREAPDNAIPIVFVFAFVIVPLLALVYCLVRWKTSSRHAIRLLSGSSLLALGFWYDSLRG